MRAPPLAQEEPRQTSDQWQVQPSMAARRLQQRLRLCLGGCLALRVRVQQVRVHPLLRGLCLLARQVMQSAPRLQRLQRLQPLVSGP
jgi:hypothetical protein